MEIQRSARRRSKPILRENHGATEAALVSPVIGCVLHVACESCTCHGPWLSITRSMIASAERHLSRDGSALLSREILVEEVGELHEHLGPPAAEQTSFGHERPD